jgi:hypothetical protein
MHARQQHAHAESSLAPPSPLPPRRRRFALRWRGKRELKTNPISLPPPRPYGRAPLDPSMRRLTRIIPSSRVARASSHASDTRAFAHRSLGEWQRTRVARPLISCQGLSDFERRVGTRCLPRGSVNETSSTALARSRNCSIHRKGEKAKRGRAIAIATLTSV